MPNKLAQFYQNFRSGDDKYTIATGRFFSITFSFPDNTLLGGVGNAVTNITDRFGLGVAGSYLQKGISLISKEIGMEENYISRFPDEEIHWLVKGINLPNMKISEGNSISLNSDSGSFSTWNVPGMGTIEPEADTFSLDLIPTVESPIEGYFHPWMEEVMSMRTGTTTPFRRANVFIQIYDENNLGDFNELNVKYTYKLSGVYPNFCDTPNLSHEGSMDNRAVGFKFNKIELFGNPLISGAKGLLQNYLGSDVVAPVRQGVDKLKRFI